MAHVEVVIRAFFTLGEAADASILSEGLEPVPSARQNLVCVGLVAHIPDDLVLGVSKA